MTRSRSREERLDELERKVAEGLARLPGPERAVMELLTPLDGSSPRSMEEVAQELDITLREVHERLREAVRIWEEQDRGEGGQAGRAAPLRPRPPAPRSAAARHPGGDG